MPVEFIRAKPRPAAGPGAPPPAAPPPAAPMGQPSPEVSPLEESHYAMVQRAVVSRKAVKRAARTALGSAAVTLFIGLSALPFTLIWPSASSLMVVVGVCVVGVVEYYGYQRMRQALPSAPAFLAKNQLAFLALITFYCLLQMAGFSVEATKAEAVSPEVRAQLAALPDMARAIDDLIEQWAPLLVYGFYLLVIGLSVCSQGGLALYYHTRRKHVDAFNRQTPAWIRRLFVVMGA
jgi:hypothetical protein